MATEDKIAENIGVVSDKLVQHMDAAEKVINQYGGDAVNLGLNVLRIEAAHGIIAGLIALAVAIACYKVFPRDGESVSYGDDVDFLIIKGFGNRTSKEDAIVKEATGDATAGKRVLSGKVDWDYGNQWIIGIVAGVLGVLTAIEAISQLTDIWNWVGIFWPEAYAVHKFLM